MIHALQLKLWPFEVFPCLYRKPCICNILRPRAHKCDDHYPLWSKLKFRLPACLVWIYNAPAQLWWFLDFFFLLSVSTSWKKRKFLNNLIHGGCGSTWGHNFYMSTQNGSKLEIWPERIFDPRFRIKVTALSSFPMFVQGSHAFAMFSAHALCERQSYAHTEMWRPLPNMIKIGVQAVC